MGQHDLPNMSTVKLYCPKCEDIYNPKSSRHASIDGAYFGTSFHSILFQVYPALNPEKSLRRYEPRIYGFRVSEMARSGPRMKWLREKPTDIEELDEARRFAEERVESDDDDENMNLNGRPVERRRGPGNARLRQQRQAQNGSPMAVERESEL